MAKDLLGSCLFNVLGAGCTIVIIAAFPVTEITIGALYLHECPVAPVIPVYVMVCGILVLMVIGLLVLPKLLCPGAPGSTIWALSIVSILLLLFIFVVYGSYHIYFVYPPNYNKTFTDTNGSNSSIFSPAAADKVLLTLENQNQNNTLPQPNHTLTKMIQALVHSRSDSGHLNAAVPYCDRTVYLFAFWTTTLAHVFAGLFLVVVICLFGCMKFSVLLVEHVYG